MSQSRSLKTGLPIGFADLFARCVEREDGAPFCRSKRSAAERSEDAMLLGWKQHAVADLSYESVGQRCGQQSRH